MHKHFRLWLLFSTRQWATFFFVAVPVRRLWDSCARTLLVASLEKKRTSLGTIPPFFPAILFVTLQGDWAGLFFGGVAARG